MKVCRICTEQKLLNCFYRRHKDKEGSEAYRNECISCKNKINVLKNANRSKQQIELDNNKKRKWYLENQEKTKQYRVDNKEKNKEYNKRWKEAHKKEVSEYNRDYLQTNKRKIINRHNKLIKQKRKNNPSFGIALNLRSRISTMIKENTKSGSAIRDLGCSISELKQRLQSMFHPNPDTGENMTWENYGRPNGKLGWDIDHIIPLSLFDLGDREQFLKACNFTNLQPLWAKPNISKGGKNRKEYK